MINNILLVGLGGGAGSILRYVCQRWFTTQYPSAFPWSTFVVNIIGCFIIGVCWGFFAKSNEEDQYWKLLLMTGLCGGFTTFSAFTLEGIGLLKEQKTGLFFLYAIGSVVLGLTATFIGMKLTR
jgi:fluoride exporter